MVRFRYVICRIDDDNYVSLDDKIYKRVNDVAMNLIHINNERLDVILKEMFDVTETLEDVDTEDFVLDALNNYTLKLVRRIKMHFLKYILNQIPIEKIPDFEYLDKLCVHIFAID